MSHAGQSTEPLAVGLALHRRGELAEAERCYQGIIDADPTHAEALKLLAVLALERGELPRALSLAERASEQRPERGEYLHLIGRIELQQGNLEAAARDLSSAAAGDMPERVAALLDLASCHGRRKAWRDSLAAANAVLAEHPNHADARRFAGYACFSLHQDAEALVHLDRCLSSDGTQANIWHVTAVIALRQGNALSAYQRACKAGELAPDNRDYQFQRRLAAAKLVPDWHFNMLHDSARNKLFAQAIAALVRPEHQVLEIGAGTGLLAMMAARGVATGEGGHRVVTCEENPALAEVASAIVAGNGLSERIHVIGKRSSELMVGVDLAEKADILICEVFSVQVVAEGVLPSLEDAKARLLKPGATVIPRAATARGALVASEGLSRKVRVGSVHGFDLSALNAFSPVIQYLQPGMELTWLSEAHDLLRFDLAERLTFPAEKCSITIEATADGLCQGVVQWLNLEVMAGLSFENRPDRARPDDSQHWAPVFYPFPEPLAVVPGQRLTLRASHNRTALRVELVG